MLSILRLLKRKIYFAVAWYFKLFAKIQLWLWRPRIVVITGSSGKTTALHLAESQLGSLARYSHHANSTFGIPFDILNLHRKTFAKSEWLSLFLAAPFKAFRKPYGEKLYIVEADAERPGEGRFLASLLKPEVVLWLNSGRSHSINFNRAVALGQFPSIEAAIAHEFGYFAEYARKMVLVNGDAEIMRHALSHTKAQVQKIHSPVQKYTLSSQGTTFNINGRNHTFPYLLPVEFGYTFAMTEALCDYLHLPFGSDFSHFVLPPSRSSILKGKKDTILVDSSYNATPEGVSAMLAMIETLPAAHKWLVLGDMIELGAQEQEEHEKLATTLSEMTFDTLVLVGPRLLKYTAPLLTPVSGKIHAFVEPKDALHYLEQHLRGGETILFKGARFLEGIIEHLLENPMDTAKLCRREAMWVKRRKEWGL